MSCSDATGCFSKQPVFVWGWYNTGVANILELHNRTRRFHHGYLLVGERGACRLEAEEAAKAILKTSTLAGHPDCLIFEHEIFGVEESHDLGGRMHTRPLSGESKVFIVLAESLTREAGNALLKNFEEPPAGTHIFFSLPRIHDVSLTLRSRLVVLLIQAAAPTTAEGEATVFIKASLGERLKRAKILQKDRPAAEALIFSLAKFSSLPTGRKMGMKGGVLTALRDATSYASDRGGSPAMLLEHLALVLPRLVE